MHQRPALVTGFEPYGGRGVNPAGEIARALDGRTIAGVPVIGRALPVSFRSIAAHTSALLGELDPLVVIALGLWPGALMIRIERFGLNLADFEIPDNDGTVIKDGAIAADGSQALAATLPVREIEAALLAAGIPAQLSTSAGTFLCNACLYGFLLAAQRQRQPALCGFIHVPYMPSQVAELLAAMRREARLEGHQRGDLASMDIRVSTKAVERALEIALAKARAPAPAA
jgi:pyroglutamyl-peptidase